MSKPHLEQLKYFMQWDCIAISSHSGAISLDSFNYNFTTKDRIYLYFKDSEYNVKIVRLNFSSSHAEINKSFLSISNISLSISESSFKLDDLYLYLQGFIVRSNRLFNSLTSVEVYGWDYNFNIKRQYLNESMELDSEGSPEKRKDIFDDFTINNDCVLLFKFNDDHQMLIMPTSQAGIIQIETDKEEIQKALLTPFDDINSQKLKIRYTID